MENVINKIKVYVDEYNTDALVEMLDRKSESNKELKELLKAIKTRVNDSARIIYGEEFEEIKKSFEGNEQMIKCYFHNIGEDYMNEDVYIDFTDHRTMPDGYEEGIHSIRECPYLMVHFFKLTLADAELAFKN